MPFYFNYYMPSTYLADFNNYINTVDIRFIHSELDIFFLIEIFDESKFYLRN